jgi:diguanylate cyclase (GGDEF)-like protein
VNWRLTLATLRQRTRSDFRLGVYVVFGALAVLILLPIAVVRVVQGAMLHAAIDFAVVAFILGATLQAWRGADLERLGILVALAVATGGCVVASLSPAGLYWLYPIVMAIAFMVRPRVSIPIYAAVILWLAIEGDALAHTGQPLAALAALVVNGVFAMIFAQRSGERRVQLEQMATVDALTGAENRRALEVELEIAIAGFQRDARPVALAVLDLDHFKTINDRFGHDEGDRVLQRFVQVVQASVRRTDRLYRYGGEEFVLLMPATDELGLELAMSHLRSQIRAALTVRDEPVTVSIGGAILRAGEKRDAWFTRADDALYRAKQGGRNRLEIDDAE